jgi:hypothetical protein
MLNKDVDRTIHEKSERTPVVRMVGVRCIGDKGKSEPFFFLSVQI